MRRRHSKCRSVTELRCRRRRFPQFDAIALGVHDPGEPAIVVFFDPGIDFDAALAIGFNAQTIAVPFPKLPGSFDLKKIPPIPVTLFIFLFRGSQVPQRAQSVFPRHLFAPVHHKVGVVERAGFVVASLSGGLNVIVIEWVSDQGLSGFADLDR